MFPLEIIARMNAEADAKALHTPSPRDGWHLVNLCMPTKAFEDVLLVVDGIVRLGYRSDVHFYDSSTHLPLKGCVSHWRPIPPPPICPEDVPF